MMRHRWHQVLAMGWAGIVTGLVGCAASPDAQIPGQRISGGVLLRQASLDQGDPRQADWLPIVGRMGAYVCQRHLATSPPWKLILDDTFANAAKTRVPSWRMVGVPVVKPINLDGVTGIELGAAKKAGSLTSPVGIERMLNPNHLRGHNVRLELRLSCRSARRAAALRGIRVLLTSLDDNDELVTLDLPITVDISPGWETQRWWLRFHPKVGPVALQILAKRAGALATIGSIRLLTEHRPPSEATTQPTTKPATTQPDRQPVNVLVGGDFESGQPTFFASASRYWPNGERMPWPLYWQFDDDATVGSKSLRLEITDEDAQIGFGPLDLNHANDGREVETIVQPTHRWHLSFHARATRTTTVTVSLRTRSRTLGRQTFQLLAGWKQFTSSFIILSSGFVDQLEQDATELLFEFPTHGRNRSEGPLTCWLDGVALTDETLVTRYVRPAPIEVGLFIPNINPSDLTNLLDVKELVTFVVRLVADRSSTTATSSTDPGASNRRANEKTTPTLAVDLLDAWDRVVWTKTTTPVIPEAGVLDDPIQLRLPRGYYRALATVWGGKPGESTVISRASMPLAVITLDDPVPWGNPFGLTANKGLISQRTTHLGAGWVRTDLSAGCVTAGDGAWDFSLWRELGARHEQAQVEIVAGLTLPISKVYHKGFMDQWLAATNPSTIGIVISPPTVSRHPAQEYIEQLTWLRETLSRRAPTTRIIGDLSAMAQETSKLQMGSKSSLPELSIGIACTETPLPEDSEALLERIGRQYSKGPVVWDLGVPVRLGSAPGNRSGYLAEVGTNKVAGHMAILETPVDPVLSASRMVRSILIRLLAGAQFICSDAFALAPVRSIHDDIRRCLHEPDLAPRVALVAFDFMTSQLNDATLVRWIDEPITGSRLLYFEKEDGGAVAALWRPSGLTPTRLGFSNLPSSIQILDCVAMPEPVIAQGNQRIILANEIVRYLVAPAVERETLRQSLDTMQILLKPATQPAL